ncbi:MAG: HNH endonuclease [Oscillatoriales cyanobacterium]|nr:MAG: HNH endonuclease [Oscillatoriales cyanobacterium]TAF21421.1 MAG: HNH endonuclease [Oscillatoriales cyanobacterium]TAF39730.1 MAG: HNH endonuclease [Oscillatoriales cyanobacterium]
MASRLMYEAHHGQIPEGMLVCHSCDNPTCVNPEHLFLGTHKDNTQDMLRKNREARGDKLPQTKLTSEQVKEIKLLLAEGSLNNGKIGKLFGVTSTTIWDIKNGITWKHI